MKVNVSIEKLERQIAACQARSNPYETGRADAYLDILCGYLDIQTAQQKQELANKCYEKWKDAK